MVNFLIVGSRPARGLGASRFGKSKRHSALASVVTALSDREGPLYPSEVVGLQPAE
jgi:hypothetical protein